MLLAMIHDDIFGKRLKLLRNKTGKSQEDVAKDLNISRARYSHYENNHVEPSIDLIRMLARYYKVDTDYLLGSTDNPIEKDHSPRDAIIHKISTEFPDVDLMFKDMEGMSAEELQEVYEFIKFKKSQKDN